MFAWSVKTVDVGIGLAAGRNCRHGKHYALQRGKTFLVIQTHLSQVLLCLFQYLCLPTTSMRSQLVSFPDTFRQGHSNPLCSLSLSPIFIPLSLSCRPKVANAVRHSQLLLQHCPVWGMRKSPLCIYFYHTFFSLPLSPTVLLGIFLMSSSTLKNISQKLIKTLIVCTCKELKRDISPEFKDKEFAKTLKILF